jgi:hypothetical protein
LCCVVTSDAQRRHDLKEMKRSCYSLLLIVFPATHIENVTGKNCDIVVLDKMQLNWSDIPPAFNGYPFYRARPFLIRCSTFRIETICHKQPSD